MSADAKTTKDLMKALEDGREGFAKGAKRLMEDSEPELSAIFERFSGQRARFYGELEALAHTYGDDIEESGSISGALHRGWMAVKDTLAGSNPKGILDAAEQGEDHAIGEYDDALQKDLSEGLRIVVQRQKAEIVLAHDEVRRLRDLQSA